MRAGKAGPVFGGILGIVPQCGFSAAASNLYSGGLITAGALVAVFLSTSDEMLPIFISEAVPAWTIIKILAVKMVMGILLQDAQGSKAPVQRLVDRIAAIFVPTIIGIALLSFALWWALAPSDGFTHGLLALVTYLEFCMVPDSEP